MLYEVMSELNNYFDVERLYGTFTISDGDLQGVDVQNQQYYRIIGSVFNDGVYRHPTSLTDETFSGAVWLLAVPHDFIQLCDDIQAWSEKNLTADSQAMSPYTSESFGGYSYSKSGANASAGGAGASWQNAFAARLNIWRKPRCRY